MVDPISKRSIYYFDRKMTQKIGLLRVRSHVTTSLRHPVIELITYKYLLARPCTGKMTP